MKAQIIPKTRNRITVPTDLVAELFEVDQAWQAGGDQVTIYCTKRSPNKLFVVPSSSVLPKGATPVLESTVDLYGNITFGVNKFVRSEIINPGPVTATYQKGKIAIS